MSDDIRFTGWDKEREFMEREALQAQCIRLTSAIGDLARENTLPTRGIKDIMRRDDQFNVNSCSGFGMTGAAEVCFWLKYGFARGWRGYRQFNPMWAYRRGQEQSGISGDRGATINGVVAAAKRVGLLPEDYDDDGIPECEYRPQYGMSYPNGKDGRTAAQIAADYKIGYSVEIRDFQEALAFLKAGQGAIVVGGDWGRWSPDGDGVVRNFREGGGGHARAYVDWITIGGQIMLVECNSHFTRYGDNGFAYWPESTFNKQAQARWTVLVGVSDLSKPGERSADGTVRYDI